MLTNTMKTHELSCKLNNVRFFFTNPTDPLCHNSLHVDQTDIKDILVVKVEDL